MDDWKALHRPRRQKPREALQRLNEDIRRNPDDPILYLERNWVWERLGRKDLALADLTQALSIKDIPPFRHIRGMLLGKLRRYQEAIADFDRAQAQDQEFWRATPSAVHRALCHASLGNLEAAMADCASLREDYWLPSIDGEPGGSKQEVTAEIRRLATSVRDACRARNCPLADSAHP